MTGRGQTRRVRNFPPQWAGRTIACLTLLACLWTLTLAPAFAAYLSRLSPAATRTQAETAVCHCLVCAGKKQGVCCCTGKNGGENRCAFRAVCDAATRAVSQPFTWWAALLPTGVTLPRPRPAFLARVPLSPSTSPLAASPAAPDIPPRFLS